jgi:hypothetical protein
VAGDIEQVLQALSHAEVRYLVVGGVAVVLHGYLRATADLDLVVQLDEANVLRAVDALEDLGYRPRPPVPARAFADAATREGWVRDKGLTVFSLWSDRFPQLEVDLFASEPFDFAAAFARAVQVPLGEHAIPVASLDDLIALKQAAGRPQDRADVEALRSLHDAGRRG